EDLPDLSFAGQQDTYLNLHGLPAVLEAVQRCWASLWTARAIGYRAQHGLDQGSLSLAVVVQALVPAEAAGVLFTAHPVTGARDQALLTATWGLGEALVGGLVTPDTLTVEKASGRVLTRETADKQVMTVRAAAGTTEQPVPEARRRAPVLDEAQAAALMRLGVQIEQLYGRPMDIEWALAPGGFAILQARPITALPEAAPPPAAWNRPDPRAMCFRGSITEQLPDPLTPLFGTLGRRLISRGTADLFNWLFGAGTVTGEMVITINGYAYYQMRLSPRLLWGMLRAVVQFWPVFKRSEARWRDEAHGRYVAVIERWRSRPAEALTAAELLEGARPLMAETVNTYNVIQSGVLGLAGGVEVLFTNLYDRLIKRRDDPPAVVLLVGFDSLPILAEKSLFDLAQQAQAWPALAEHLQRTPTAELTRALAGDEPPPGPASAAWPAWQAGFRAHLERYGHTAYDLDFAKPLPADDPTPLLEACKMYLAGRGPNPHARQQALAGRREQTTQALVGRLSGLRLKLFRTTLRWAQKFAPMREDCLADLGLGYPLLRQFLRELGRRLTQAGALAKADDIFWLLEDEAAEAAAALDRPAPPARYAAAIRERQTAWEAQQRLSPPTALPERSRFSAYLEKLGPANMRQAAGRSLKGAGTSQGRLTGRARVLHSPADFGQMRPGEILVAATTTPAWTPLFAMAAAIVTDIGGPLSHGSIVAREYGIPAVMGTGLATRRIHSGDVITVDGGAGVVTLAPEAISR
ncbi:MAG: hypothetical protein JNK29_08285, partial [Anaerolineales bacterium]|nr:hypothetical protein [Anaerolineales bacterium]